MILIFQLSPDKMDFILRLTYTCIATVIVNLPFGYIRGGFRKLSFWWFVAIHAPVPIVIMIRKFHDLELSWILAPFLLSSFFIGQFLGKKIYELKRIKRKTENKTRAKKSC